MTKSLAVILLSILAGCYTRVGNPQPEPDGKTSVQVSISSEETFSFQELELNLVGVKLLTNDEETSNISFASAESLVFNQNNAGDRLIILRSTTKVTGTYGGVRLHFNNNDLGTVTVQNTIYPLELDQNTSFVDVPITFKLNKGVQTNISLDMILEDFIQAVTNDATGEITGFTVSKDVKVNAKSEEVVNDLESSTKSYQFYRLSVSKVNKGQRVQIRNLSLQLEGLWQTKSDKKDSNGRYLLGPHAFEISASTNSHDAEKAFDTGNMFRTAYRSNEMFANDTGVHVENQSEYLQLNFMNPVAISGYEFSGFDGDDCALTYGLQGSHDGVNWTTIAGTSSTLEACELVNVSW